MITILSICILFVIYSLIRFIVFDIECDYYNDSVEEG